MQKYICLTNAMADASAQIASRHLDGFDEDIPYEPEMEEKCTVNT